MPWIIQNIAWLHERGRALQSAGQGGSNCASTLSTSPSLARPRTRMSIDESCAATADIPGFELRSAAACASRTS